MQMDSLKPFTGGNHLSSTADTSLSSIYSLRDVSVSSWLPGSVTAAATNASSAAQLGNETDLKKKPKGRA